MNIGGPFSFPKSESGDNRQKKARPFLTGQFALHPWERCVSAGCANSSPRTTSEAGKGSIPPRTQKRPRRYIHGWGRRSQCQESGIQWRVTTVKPSSSRSSARAPAPR
jgi:hypothetical protein